MFKVKCETCKFNNKTICGIKSSISANLRIRGGRYKKSVDIVDGWHECNFYKDKEVAK